MYNDENTKPPVKVRALSKIMDSTMKLTELYDALPIIAAIRNCVASCKYLYLETRYHIIIPFWHLFK